MRRRDAAERVLRAADFAAGFDAAGNVDETKPRIPTEYLKYLFGDAVEPALATLRAEMAKTKAGGSRRFSTR